MTLPDAISLIDTPYFHALTSPVHWADLGCGSGTFTLALASLLPAGSTVEAIDLHPGITRQTTKNGVTINPRTADFEKDELELKDGILMANSLHYVREKLALLQRLKSHLHPAGALLLVEYDTDRPVPTWVPYPISFETISNLLPAAGWQHIQKLGTRPSAFGRKNLYGALALSS
jgi:ubiquinone/menaquinone biosynthesis C-methylase UbiE